MIGTTVGHYSIVEKLGEGGMGIVYKATDTKLERPVALKFLPDRVQMDSSAKARFLQEARAAAGLNHPNICTIHGIEEIDGSLFIVMEYIEGGTLAARLAAEPKQDVVQLATQIAGALHTAHVKGIVHRDVKPENVMVSATGQSKIMDFGLARLKGSLRLTQSSNLVGTLAYMAPEVIQGEESDARSDIFSFGVMLYEMLTGNRPFRGEHDAAMMYSIVHDRPQPISSGGSGLHARLAPVIYRMLEKDPSDRYQSLDEVSGALQRLSGTTIQRTDDEGERAPGPTSIAVLPFADLSPGKDQDYFCDGIAEEIINALSKLTDLRVVARTSAFAFKGKHQDVRDIGTRLNVSTVLEGSLRKSGKRLRITAQLINVSDGYQVWSERYDREEADVFLLQDEISSAIVTALKAKLTTQGEGPLVRAHTDNIDAYNLYLKGRHHWATRTADGLSKSVDYFRKAIGKEPGYALAYAALADSYCLLCSYHLLSPEESIPLAKEAAVQATELDPTLAEAHEALGHVILLYDWDWAQALREYREAIRLNPLFSTAHQRLALLHTITRQHADAASQITTAEKLDPLSLIIITDNALVSYIRGQHDEAVATCRRVLDLNPEFHVAWLVQGLAHEQKGDLDEALRCLQRSVETSGKNSIMRSSLAHCYGIAGRTRDALDLVEELERETAYVSPYSHAVANMGLGKISEAMTWLGRAVEERSVWHIHLHAAVDPRLAGLRSDPAGEALFDRLKIPQSTRA